uniref:Uncharacterized protein n=1 Tax=Thermogemmatispora argillosa TaxID=2045280 RepID=A0A455T4K3_9CHLR|nr:hypothetical protein KTA_29550 [Thermogemmatispora argillosa]
MGNPGTNTIELNGLRQLFIACFNQGHLLRGRHKGSWRRSFFTLGLGRLWERLRCFSGLLCLSMGMMMSSLD